MFIELTDHLRCVRDHAESYLVLIPDVMEGRRVIRGTLGCPVCRAEYRIEDAVATLGDPRPTRPAASGDTPAAGALQAFLGIEGPGGYIGLIGDAGLAAPGLAPLLSGVHQIAVNPPTGVAPGSDLSVLRASRLPLRSRGLRGVVLGQPEAADPAWRSAAIAALLPGLRATGAGPAPLEDGFELLGEAGGWWVGRRAAADR